MRFLKLKIQKARSASHKKSPPNQYVSCFKDSLIKKEEGTPSTLIDEAPLDTRMQRTKRTPVKEHSGPNKEGWRTTKNIVINYGKAIASFASSDLAKPYLKEYVQDEGVSYEKFLKFIIEAKETIGGIASFRSLLIDNDQEEKEMRSYKKILRRIGEVFIKYFSVNWIIHGRMAHKMTYLKFRSRMLRRIKNPEYFTYIRKEIPKNVKE